MAAFVLITVLLAILNITWACPKDCKYCTAKFSNLNKTFALVRAICEHNPDMITIPQDLPTNLGLLMFKSNGLKHLTTASLDKYPYLQILDLSNNKLGDIENGAFLKQRFLTKLVLQDNNLKKLSTGMLIGLYNLQELYLQKNDISGLQKDVFRSLTSLRVLNLHDNNIEHVAHGTFEGLDFLKELDMSGCFIKKIGAGSLGNLMSLETINLSYNTIEAIHDQTFSCSPLLKTLHINNNNLTIIPDLRQLQFLQELDVSGNPINYIHMQTFTWNHQLKKLNISFCQLTFLPEETLAGLKDLQNVSLEGNPLHCDCRIKSLHHLLVGTSHIFNKPSQIECKTPLKQAGKTIQNAKAADFNCSCNDCKRHAACRSQGDQCSCTASGLEYQTCDSICTSRSKYHNCTYINGKCLCSNPNFTANKTWKCNFQMTNKTCNKHAQMKKVGRNLDCVCSKGFVGDGIDCKDVDECKSSFRRCIDKKSICKNTIGSYECECLPGYHKRPPFLQTCADVNECRKKSSCDEHGVCYNTQGSFRCKCDKGFHNQANKCYPLLFQDEIHVTTQPLNSSAILVQWNISAKIDLIASVRILYLPFGPLEIKLMQAAEIYSGNATGGVLSNLLADTTYNIMVEVYMIYNTTVKSQIHYAATEKRSISSKQAPIKSTNITAVIISSLVLTVIITIVAGLVVFYCIVKKRRNPSRENSENINSHMEDLIELRTKDQSLVEGTSYSDRQPAERRRSEKSAALEAWEIPRNQLKIGEIIGEGHFGVVLQGTLTTDGGVVKVAVKTIKDADRFDMKDFMLEMEMMKEIGYHPNVVSLLGVSSIGAPLYIITEYVDGGNLLDLLRSSRFGSSNYANVVSSLNSRDLLNIALDVCKGMRHIASKKLVHRDLAARNVLMTKDLVAKIGDFGLARDVYCEGIYVKTGGGRLPIKWMAPESIKDRTYTVKSDVWSFGILMWELVTLGGSPFPSMPLNLFLEKLLYGYRMPKPDHCSGEVYTIMEECWMLDPVARPNFDFLSKELVTLLSEEGRTYINVKGLALDRSLDQEDLLDE